MKTPRLPGALDRCGLRNDAYSASPFSGISITAFSLSEV
jgi:hypothetical protein